MIIYEKLREIRKSKGLTLREASKKCGLSHQYLWKVETGKVNDIRTPGNKEKIAELYGIPVEDFVNTERPPLKAKRGTGVGERSKANNDGKGSPPNNIPFEKQLLAASNRFLPRWAPYNNGVGQGVDVETSLGYPTEISYYDYLHRYKRQDIANRVINAPVKATWAETPNVYEAKDKLTSFEKDWSNLTQSTDVYRHLYKVDLLAMIGSYACLYLGLSGASPLDDEPAPNSELVYITPIPEPNVQILEYDNDMHSPRFGMPHMYTLTIRSNNVSSVTKSVHWKRVLHLAENTLDDDLNGSPALEPIYNRLIGLEKIAGASPEIYWLGARGGFAAQTNKDSGVLTTADREEMEEQLSEFTNNLRRWLFADGVDIKSMAPQVVSPKDHIDAQLQLISAATRIPIRILTGSERGELASSQDERTWLSYVEERREEVGSELIIKPFIDRMIELDIISAPDDKYTIEWPRLVVLSDKEKAEVGKIHAETLNIYSDSISSSQYLPPEMFLKRELGLSDSEVKLAYDITKKGLEEEDKDIDIQ